MMPTLARGLYKRTYGFTLLELMVVMIVIGISLSLIVPNFMKNDEDVLNEESMRLSALLEYAADTSNSRGVWLGWRPTETGYLFLQHDDDKDIWQPIVNDDLLRIRQLPAGVQLSASTQQQSKITVDNLIPLSPSGIFAPVQITLSIGGKKRIVQGNLLGKFESVNPNLIQTPL